MLSSGSGCGRWVSAAGYSRRTQRSQPAQTRAWKRSSGWGLLSIEERRGGSCWEASRPVVDAVSGPSVAVAEGLRLALAMACSISAVRVRPGVGGLGQLCVVSWEGRGGGSYRRGLGRVSAPCGPARARHPSSHRSGRRRAVGCNGRPWLRRAAWWRACQRPAVSGRRGDGRGRGKINELPCCRRLVGKPTGTIVAWSCKTCRQRRWLREVVQHGEVGVEMCDCVERSGRCGTLLAACTYSLRRWASTH